MSFLAQFGTMAAICHFDTSVTPGGGIHISSRSFILLFSILLPYHVGFESYKDIFRLQKLKAALRKQNLNLIKSNIKKKKKNSVAHILIQVILCRGGLSNHLVFILQVVGCYCLEELYYEHMETKTYTECLVLWYTPTLQPSELQVYSYKGNLHLRHFD